MITYEITAEVAPALAAEYEAYMRGHHIPDLMATGCFAGASLSRAGARYRVRYEAFDAAALERYLAEHAPRLRDEFTRRFPEGITLARENWMVLERWTGRG